VRDYGPVGRGFGSILAGQPWFEEAVKYDREKFDGWYNGLDV
jgi:hypothetical protein